MKSKEYRRFTLSVIIQHLILTIATLLLIITGLPLKFYSSGWAISVMKFLGGTEKARELHHLAALFLIIAGVIHLAYIIFSKKGRKDFKDFIPVKQDFFDIKDQILYMIGRRETGAQFGRFSYIEKFDYWAVYWGFVIMIGSGLVMWFYQAKLNPLFIGEISLKFLPDFTNYYIHAISRELHSDEALLATLAIIGWHFYNVIFNPAVFPVQTSIFTGKMSREEMERDHPKELEMIEAESVKNINQEIDVTILNEEISNEHKPIDEVKKEEDNTNITIESDKTDPEKNNSEEKP